jgi:hypothetical protein
MNEIPPYRPPMDNGKLGYVWKDKRFARPSTTRDKASKNKGKTNISLSKIQNTKAQPNKLNLQVDEDFLAFHNSSTPRTLVASSTKVDVKVKDDGQKKKQLMRHCKISNLWIP